MKLSQLIMRKRQTPPQQAFWTAFESAARLHLRLWLDQVAADDSCNGLEWVYIFERDMLDVMRLAGQTPAHGSLVGLIGNIPEPGLWIPCFCPICCSHIEGCEDLLKQAKDRSKNVTATTPNAAIKGSAIATGLFSYSNSIAEVKQSYSNAIRLRGKNV